MLSRFSWTRWTRLQKALFISFAFHGALLTLRITAPERFDRLFRDVPLDVILVNTRVKAEAPDKAQALAQTQLAGGGELKSGRAASPLPTAATTSLGRMTDTMHRQLAAMRKEQSLLLAQVKNVLAQLPPPQPQKTQAAQDEVEQKRRQLLKLLAEIEERINQDNARPRKHYISPATREATYALYYDALRRKIEERGTRYFPATNQGEKLYGELTMIITVNTHGRVLSTEVVQSSGLADLDRRAQAIATAAGPFGEFTEDMRKQTDQLALVSRFIFSRNNTLQTRGGETTH
ncbi:TonB family protein [Limnohabitans sp.]|uniref:energy transducer TonB n=1 Tax=Limnohabitans sp. TaxID=1907725 RepID=UPI00286F3083|nr:TonB family protein [Limnohabitans sp.]